MEISASRCCQCAGCAASCPAAALVLKGERIVWSADKCTRCGICVRACPARAIVLKKD